MMQAVVQNLQPREPTRRMIVSDPEPFDGNDAKLYPPWEQAVGAKFRTDGWAYNTEVARVDYMYNRLKGKAQIQAEQWLKQVGLTASRTEENFKNFLRHRYCDPEQRRRAQDKLHSFKQLEKQSVRGYITAYDSVLVEAGGQDWNDEFKIRPLKNGLRKDIVDQLVGHKEPEDYEEFCTFILMIDRQMSEAKSREPTFRRDYKPKAPLIAAATVPVGDAMDWVPTIAAMSATDREKIIAIMRQGPLKKNDEEKERLKKGSLVTVPAIIVKEAYAEVSRL